MASIRSIISVKVPVFVVGCIDLKTPLQNLEPLEVGYFVSVAQFSGSLYPFPLGGEPCHLQ